MEQISYLSNIEISQYGRFETMFTSQRREDITSILENIPKKHVVAILDAYDEMVHEINPEIIKIEDCIKLAVSNGVIEPNLYDVNNLYRDLAAAVINNVEDELYDLLPDPVEDEESEDGLSKICGETYYSLEDNLTELFKNANL